MEEKQERYGLIGRHLKHSYSREIHEMLEDYTYDLIELEPEEVQRFLDKSSFKAINVTIPYKQTVIPFLDEMDPTVRKMNSCNCIVNKDGRLIGFNTDYDGITATFKAHDIDVKGKKALILGNGGVCKTYHTWLEDHGIGELHHVYYKDHPDCISYQEAYEKHADADLIINGTPAGMYPNVNELACDLTKFEHPLFVVDAIYNPFKTRLLMQADKLGIENENGLLMLVVQAIKAIQHFTDKPLDENKSQEVVSSIMKDRLNIVLIGMPSSGKTTIAKALENKLNKKAVDIDDEILKEIQMPIASYFEKEGEAAFRRIEKEITSKWAKESHCILATGGGVVLDPENVEALQQNSLIIYIRRPLDLLQESDPTRPTLKNGVRSLYESRKELYENSADFIVENDGSIEEAVKKIIKFINSEQSLQRFASRKEKRKPA